MIWCHKSAIITVKNNLFLYKIFNILMIYINKTDVRLDGSNLIISIVHFLLP